MTSRVDAGRNCNIENPQVILAEPATMTSRAVHEELETEGVIERKKWEGASGRRNLPQ